MPLLLCLAPQVCITPGLTYILKLFSYFWMLRLNAPHTDKSPVPVILVMMAASIHAVTSRFDSQEAARQAFLRAEAGLKLMTAQSVQLVRRVLCS